MDSTRATVAAYLFDVDGTLLTESGAVPGAAAAITRLRRRGVPFRILTNITRRSRLGVQERLWEHGFDVAVEEVLTAVSAAADWLRRRGVRIVAPFVADDALVDLREFTLVGGTAGAAPEAAPEVVLVGDVGEGWSHHLLNEAFRYVMDGARLLALQRGRYWLGPTGLEVDAGAYVAALEHATSQSAVVCGKPNVEFFQAATADLVQGVPLERRSIAMVGDDLGSDIEGAQKAGLQGWLVRTGKFRQDDLESSAVVPDRVIDSVAALD